MVFKVIEMIVPSAMTGTVMDLARNSGAFDIQALPLLEPGRQQVRLLVGEFNRQQLLDRMQFALRNAKDWRIILLPADAVIPKIEDARPEVAAGRLGSQSSREEVYLNVARGARLDKNFLILVLLSTLVAAIGLVEDNVTAVIGAMVIAPLLGPNLAFAFGAVLGDGELMLRSLRTNAVGIGLSFAAAAAITLVFPTHLDSAELLLRTRVGYSGILLALASGAAAALSVTTGLSGTLVGVMVAVALLPPAATLAIVLAAGRWDMAFGAATLLAVNVVSVNLAAVATFFLQGIRPSGWLERKAAKQSVLVSSLVLLAMLAVLSATIYLRALE